MNIEKLQGNSGQPLTEGCGEIKDIGTLELYDRSIKYTYNFGAIYANGNLFCPTYNDCETAKSVFSDCMKAAFGDQFVLKTNA